MRWREQGRAACDEDDLQDQLDSAVSHSSISGVSTPPSVSEWRAIFPIAIREAEVEQSSSPEITNFQRSLALA